MPKQWTRYLSLLSVSLTIAALAFAVLACNLSRLDEGGGSDDADNRPLVALLAPVNGSVYAEGAVVHLYAIAQEPVTGVARIEFRVDDAPVGEIVAEQPEGQTSLDGVVQWTATGRTGHLITAEGFRANGSSLGLSDAAVRVVGRPAEQATADALGAGQPTPDATSPPAPELPDPEPTNEPPPNEPQEPQQPAALVVEGVPAIVTTPDLNVRQGPGTAYPSVGTLPEGETITIIGRNADSSWWAISYQGGSAWVFAGLTAPQGDVSDVPLVAAPPLQ